MSPLASTYVTVTEQPAICEPLSEGRPEATLRRVRPRDDPENRIATLPRQPRIAAEHHRRLSRVSRHPAA